ncbi:MAG TPA: phosphate ABC transporter substrate-binding protein PstS [Rhodocyclaceae bacterium]|nr:phosphate ABC transporter substrate-binding protein PstS [Rhodocyclaceae bacterium]
MNVKHLPLASLLLFAVSPLAHGNPQATGAGASFPAPVYRSWAKNFEASQKIAIAYESVGSGEGVRRIVGRAIDFGASDTALSAEELRKRGLIQIPTLIGGIVPVVNVPGAGSLRLTGDVLARIYLGGIGSWDHADIKALNPHLQLPRQAIVRVVRSDESGSTKAFTAYLSGVSPQWAAAIGARGLPRWPAEVLAAKGSEGVRDAVRVTPGAIGYIGYNYVARDRLNSALLRNRAGRFVAPGEAAFAEAVRASGMADSVSGQVSLIDREGGGSWPITETTYVLFERSPKNEEGAKLALKFFFWAFQQGDDMARDTGFIPLPTPIQFRAVRLFSEVRDRKGAPLNFF